MKKTAVKLTITGFRQYKICTYTISNKRLLNNIVNCINSYTENLNFELPVKVITELQ